MGTRNKTNAAFLSTIGILYVSALLILQVIVPYFVASDSLMAKMSLEFQFMTYAILSVIFSSHALWWFVVYVISLLLLIVSYIGIIRKKDLFYSIPLGYLIIDIIYTLFTHTQFHHVRYLIISILFKLVGVVLTVLILSQKNTGDGSVC